MTNTNQVAKTILEQLGGNKFIVMTGAKNFVGSEETKSLSFRLPARPGYTKNGINYVRISLSPMDTYTMEFLRVRGTTATVEQTDENVYAEDLCKFFEDATGLRTRLF
jgi:hypothetical protein